MKKSLHRKAIVFSIIALLLATLFISIFYYDLQSDTGEMTNAALTRSLVLDYYVRNLDNYATQSLKIASYHALDDLARNRSISGTFFSDEPTFENVFTQCVQCGYMNCSSRIAPCPHTGGNYTLEWFIENITTLANENLNINTTYTVKVNNITQTYPFQVDVAATISYLVIDNNGKTFEEKRNYFSWNRTVDITASIQLTGLLDPFSVINTHGAYNHTIHETALCMHNSSCWNLATTRQFYDEQGFRAYGNGTSYLSRFWNSSATSSCCGIESLLNTTFLMPVNSSYVDNYYWSGRMLCNATNNVTTIQIDNITSGFLLDDKTASRYNIAADGVVVCR